VSRRSRACGCGPAASGGPAMPCRGMFGPLSAALLLVIAAGVGRAGQAPAWLPCYDLDIRLETDQHQALVRERVTWTNRHPCQVREIVFNAHSNWKIDSKDVGFLAKMLEILRLAPSEAMDFEGHACQVQRAGLVGSDATKGSDPVVADLPFHYESDNPTALVVPLPHPVGRGESVTLDLEFVMRLPPKQGRWGQWKGVTF